MAAATRALKIDWAPRAGRKAFPVVNSDTVYPNTLVALDPSDGMLKPWANTAGYMFQGMALDGQTTSKEVEGDGTDVPANRMRVNREGPILRDITVTGTSAVTDVPDMIYCSTDNPNDGTLVPTLNVGPIARLLAWKTGTTCDIQLLTPEEYARAAIVHEITIPVALASITAAGDVLTTKPMPNAGHVVAIDAYVKVAVTTGSKAATINLEIGTTNLTGGTVALTSANSTPLGAKVAGAAITGTNTFAAGDTLSVEAASVTAFAEGEVILVIRYRLVP